MTEKKEGKGGFARHAESEAKKDLVPMSERGGSVVAVVGAFVVFLFFYLHQAWETGFFASGFGSLEAFFLYAPIVLFAVTVVARIVVGRKNVVRPLDAALLVLVAVGTVWLYIVFPFDFAHLADVLPGSLRFVLAWINDDIARLVMILQLLGSSFFAVYTAALYVYVRRELSATRKSGD